MASKSERKSVAGKTVADFPELVAQWHPTKNGEVTPDQVAAGSSKKVWWKCPEGPDHEWHAVTSSRTRGNKCPACRGSQVSVTNSLVSLFPEIAAQWHPTKNGALRVDQVVAGSGKRVWWKCPKGPDHEWQTTPAERTHQRGETGCPACSGRKVSCTNSLAARFPKIALQWHPTKNGSLTPEQVVAGSDKRVWWKCSKGADHEWKAALCNRTGRGDRCPFCSGKRASKSTSLSFLYPEVAAQWHPTRNGDLEPTAVTPGSNKNVWWRCNKGPGHEWRARVAGRALKNLGCPYCSGRKVSLDNNLAFLNPLLAAQWHPTKNGELRASNVTTSSSKKVWWKCLNGSDHEWAAVIASRSSGVGCPFCAGKRASQAYNLAVLYPTIASEWHQTKNGKALPINCLPGATGKVWWKCPKGPDHEWRVSPNSRTTHRSGCPFCANLQVSSTNSLATLFPQIAAQWHPTKNGELTPDQVVAGANRKIWWKCPRGPDHEWQAVANSRTSSGAGCPACAGKQVSVTNSLASLFPEVASEWHPTKNGKITPNQVVAGTNKRVWWQCENDAGHEWQTAVAMRTTQATGCPFCSIIPRSKQEVRLAFELGYHLPIDHEMHKVKVDNKLWDVDICLPENKLLIEFDGSFWHEGKAEADKAKAKALRKDGWTVVRVREEPLKKLSKWNVVVPFNADADVAATLVLQHLQSVCGIEIPRMDERLAADGPLCADQAEEYIQKLLAEKEEG